MIDDIKGGYKEKVKLASGVYGSSGFEWKEVILDREQIDSLRPGVFWCDGIYSIKEFLQITKHAVPKKENEPKNIIQHTDCFQKTDKGD